MTVVIKEIRYVVCESCVEAVVEEGFFTEPDLDDEDCEASAAEFARAFGADLPDHLCDETEGNLPQSDTCVCGCREDSERPSMPEKILDSFMAAYNQARKTGRGGSHDR